MKKGYFTLCGRGKVDTRKTSIFPSAKVYLVDFILLQIYIMCEKCKKAQKLINDLV